MAVTDKSINFAAETKDLKTAELIKDIIMMRVADQRQWRFRFTCFILTLMLAAGACMASVSCLCHTITAEEGLTSNSVLSVFKDKTGFIWVGTEKGLLRFDGNNIVSYPVTADDEIVAMDEMDDARLLYGTVSQLKSFNRYDNTVKTYDIPSSYVRAVKTVSSRAALVGTDNGLFLLNGGKIEKLMLETGLSLSNEITGVKPGGRGIYWITTADGLVRFDLNRRTNRIFRLPGTGAKTNYFTCLSICGDRIFLGTFNNGLFSFDLKTCTFANIPGFEHNLIQTVSAHRDAVYIGTNGRGLKILDRKTSHITALTIDKNRNNSLHSNTITSFLYDSGVLWIGTQFGGLSYTPRSEDMFKIYRHGTFNSADYRVTSFFFFEDGSKLVGTRDGLFYLGKGDNGQVTHYTINKEQSGLRSDIITYIGRTNGKILVCTYGGGIVEFDKSSLRLRDVSGNDMFRFGCVFQFEPDSAGNIWVATQEGLYHATAGGRILSHLNHLNSPLPTSIVRRVKFDTRGRLWVGTKFGLCLLDTVTGKISVDMLDRPKRDHIHNLYLSKNGLMFVCGAGGLSIVGPELKTLRHFDKSGWLNGSWPVSVAEGWKQGQYWITTEKEIISYTMKDTVIQRFLKQDGLPSLSFNYNSKITADGIIYFANEGGLVCSDLRMPRRRLKSLPGKPIVVSCAFNDTVVDILRIHESHTFVVPHDAGTVTFNVSNMNYTLPYSDIYEYMLEGYDSGWRRLSGSNVITYRNLPAGNYELKLRNPDNGQMSEVRVVVERSYLSIAAIASAVIAVLVLALYFLNQIRVLRIRLHRERKIFASTTKGAKAEQETGLPAPDPVFDRLLDHMDTVKPYLNPRLNIKDVAASLGVADIELSKSLHNCMDVNWATFVNTYRVNEVKKRIENGELSVLTLQALAEKCGFGSKATFHRVFKNLNGITPLEYCESLGIKVTDKN